MTYTIVAFTVKNSC